MLDPYRMVFVNVALSVALIIFLLIYRKRNPDKKINYLYLLILISLLPLVSILRRGVYESGDFVDHVKGTMEFFKPLTEGILLPRLTETTCNGYTCADFIFHYLSPHYLLSFLPFLGVSFIASEKIFLVITFILSGITMYYWLKSEFNEKAAFVGSLFYLFAPYHLVDLHFRTDIGELLCFALLPLALTCTKRLVNKMSKSNLLWLILIISTLILSHQVISLISIIFIICYAVSLQYGKSWKNLRYVLLALITSTLLTAFYWIPLLVEKSYIAWGNGGQINLLKIQDLLYSPYRLGFLFQGHHGELSFLIGYAQIIVIIYCIYLLLKKRVEKKAKPTLVAFLLLFFILATLMINISYPLWHGLPLLSFFGFSYRLLLFECLFTAYFAAFVTTKIKNGNWILLLCVIAIFSTVLNWGNRKTLPNVNDSLLQKELTTESFGKNNLTLPIWVKGDYYYKNGRVKTHIDLTKGNATIKEIKRNTNYHEYLIEAKSESEFRENTFYFPGWQLYVDGRPNQIRYENVEQPGTMYFSLKKGLHDVEFKFTDTWDRSLGKAVSLITLVLLMGYLWLFKPHRR